MHNFIFQHPDAALPRTPTGKQPLAQLQNKNQANMSPLKQSPQKVSRAIHSPVHSSAHSSTLILDTPPAKRRMVEHKKERSKTDAKDEKKPSKRHEKKQSKEAVNDKSQTRINQFFVFSPPQSKEKKEVIPNECSPVKKTTYKRIQHEVDVSSPSTSATWDSPLCAIPRIKPDAWEDSVDEEESPPELDSQCDVSPSDYSKHISIARSPVKLSTPIRRHCKEEDVEILRLFPDPGKC